MTVVTDSDILTTDVESIQVKNLNLKREVFKIKDIKMKWSALSPDKMFYLTTDKNSLYSSVGQCLSIVPSAGEGTIWMYGIKDFFDIKIHDFFLYEDAMIECNIKGYLSVFYYDSFSGEQLNPYRRINAGCIQNIVGKDEPYKIHVHKNIPIRCIGIGISPAYYENYMKEHFKEEYTNPYSAFENLDSEEIFPELVVLLKKVWHYRGSGMAARMFYEGKVAEMISMLIERNTSKSTLKKVEYTTATQQDLIRMGAAVSYINDHYECKIQTEHLAQIACMSITKFRMLFKQIYHITVTEYIQERRISHAECLLSETDLTIGQIANSVGYSTSSRLSNLFLRSVGQTPLQYRKFSQNRKMK